MIWSMLGEVTAAHGLRGDFGSPPLDSKSAVPVSSAGTGGPGAGCNGGSAASTAVTGNRTM